LSVTIDRYTRYYVNQSGGGEIGPVYRASFRVQRGNGIGSFFRGSYILLNLYYIQVQRLWKGGFKNKFQCIQTYS